MASIGDLTVDTPNMEPGAFSGLVKETFSINNTFGNNVVTQDKNLQATAMSESLVYGFLAFDLFYNAAGTSGYTAEILFEVRRVRGPAILYENVQNFSGASNQTRRINDFFYDPDAQEGDTYRVRFRVTTSSGQGSISVGGTGTGIIYYIKR